MTQLFLRRLIIICCALLVFVSAMTVGYAPQAEPVRAKIHTYVDPVLDYSQKLGGPIAFGTFALNQLRKLWKVHPV